MVSVDSFMILLNFTEFGYDLLFYFYIFNSTNLFLTAANEDMNQITSLRSDQTGP